MKKVLVIGASGMLGHEVANQFAKSKVDLTITTRSGSTPPGLQGIKTLEFNIGNLSVETLKNHFDSGTYVINCIGKLKKDIHAESPSSVEDAILVNSLFPYKLNELAQVSGGRIIQIATDCVFSGAAGKYLEKHPHDAIDIYGKTKSLGQVQSTSVMNIGCSIVGPELVRKSSLFEWVLNQKPGSLLTGFDDHFWNGVTTKAFAKVVSGIVDNNLFAAGTQHLVPANIITKDRLIREISSAFNRKDLQIASGPSGFPIDRTLGTQNPDFNRKLWASAGYDEPPQIEQLIAEMVY